MIIIELIIALLSNAYFAWFEACMSLNKHLHISWLLCTTWYHCDKRSHLLFHNDLLGYIFCPSTQNHFCMLLFFSASIWLSYTPRFKFIYNVFAMKYVPHTNSVKIGSVKCVRTTPKYFRFLFSRITSWTIELRILFVESRHVFNKWWKHVRFD